MAVGEQEQVTNVKHVETSPSVAKSPHHPSRESHPRQSHPCQPDALATNESCSRVSEKPAVRSGWRHVLKKQFCYEASKAIHLQLDCGLYGRDWRVIYGGSSIRFFGPSVMLVLRAALFAAHTGVMFATKFYEDMLFFTTWTNVVALAFFFLSTLVSIAAIGSLSSERRIREESLGTPVRRSPVAFLDRAEAQYMVLMSQKSDGSATRLCTETAVPPLRKCFSFRRPFSGSPRMVALEALLTSEDVATVLALPMVTVMFIVYWTMLFPLDGSTTLWLAIYMHLYAPVASWVVAGFSRLPYRLSLACLFISMGACYVILIIILQQFGHGFVYWFLNFRKRPGLAAGLSLVLLLVCGPIVSCLSWMVLLRNTAAVDPAKR